MAKKETPAPKPVVNLFATAKTVEKKTVAAKKKEKLEVQMTDLDALSAIVALEKALKGMSAALMSSVKGQMLTKYVELGVDLGAKPDSFRGVAEKSSASCELRKRSTRSPLTEDEVKVLDTYDIPYTKTEADVFYFNPKVLDSESAMAKISAALAGVDLTADIGANEGVILHKANNAMSITDESVTKAFQVKSEKILEILLPIVGTLAVKPKLTVNDLQNAFAILTENGLSLTAEDDSE